MRPIFIFLLIFTLCGCGDDQYAIEKKYWQAQRQADRVFNNPNATPPKQLERVVGILKSFAKKYPKINLALDARFNIARLYMAKEQYLEARQELNKIITDYKKFNEIVAETIFLLGNSYELENKWGMALEQYQKIMQDYAATLRGMNIPVYIAEHYRIKYQPDKMVEAFRSAIAHYRSLAEKSLDTPLAYTADQLAAQCYVALKEWQGALNTYAGMLEKYKGKTDLSGVLMNMAFIYHNELKDEIKAKEMLERLSKEYPNSRLIKSAQALLEKKDKK
jgi:TolA-binding protein